MVLIQIIGDNDMEIHEIINSIFLLLTYFIPGYIFISVYSWGANHSTQITVGRIATCVVIGVLLFSIMSTVHLPSPYVLLSIGVIIALILAICAVIITRSQWFSRVTVKLLHKSPITDFWYETTLPKGVWYKVVCGNRIYCGSVDTIDEGEGSSWILLGYYSITENNATAFCEEGARLAILLEDADYIEVSSDFNTFADYLVIDKESGLDV